MLCLTITLGGCGSGTIETAADAAVDSVEPCHFATTLPGGELPQPQCEPAEEPVVTSPPTSVGAWECPEEDYPIFIVATTWQPFGRAQAQIMACGGGEVAEISAPAVLIPTQPVSGIDETADLGLRVLRQPGGRFWQSTVQIPSIGDPSVTLESITIGVGTAPDEDIAEWIAGEQVRNCNIADAEPVVVRGVDGCRVDRSVIAWVDGMTSHRLVIAPAVGDAASADELVAWLDAWEPAA